MSKVTILLLVAYFNLTMEEIVNLNSIKTNKKCAIYSIKNDDLYIYGLRENQLVEVLYKTVNFIVILFDDSILYLNKSEVKEIDVKVL